MFIHCKPYTYIYKRILSAVSAMLLGSAYSSATCTTPVPTHLPRIALLGDSMTWIGGDSCQNPTGWSYVLKQSGIASAIDVYARSGATWTNTASTHRNPQHYTELLHDDNVVYNQAIRLIERADTADVAPDIIILFAGANDAWFASRRPGIFDKTKQATDRPDTSTSLAASISLVYEILNSRFPDATFVFVTPLQMSKTDADTIFKVAEIIEKTASDKGCKTLRADMETGITHDQEAKSPTYTSDGVHTNPAGARILGNFITGNLLTLPPINSYNKQLTTDN